MPALSSASALAATLPAATVIVVLGAWMVLLALTIIRIASWKDGDEP